jgi:ribonuclease P protein component
MLPKAQRLNLANAKWRYHATDFQASSPSFKVLAKKTNSPSKHFGFLVTGKIGKATVRNQIKRWLSQAVEDNLENFPEGFDFIFIAYPLKEEGSYEKFSTSLNQVLPKISLLR